MSVPLLLGFGFALLYSFGWVGLLNKGFTLNHWQNLFSSSGAVQSLWYTGILTLFSVVLVLSLSLLLSWSWWVHSKSQYPKWLALPLLFPPLIAGFVWYQILYPGGLFSRLAYALGLVEGLENFPRMVNDQWSIGILVVHTFLILPIFSILFIETGKKENMDGLWATSATLGATKFHFFKKVYVPVLLRKSQAVIWLYGIFLAGTYEVPLLLGRSNPQVVSVFITEKLNKFNLQEIPSGYAMAVLYSVIMFTLIFLFIRKKSRVSW